MKEKELNELAKDVVSFLYGNQLPKKKLAPLVKQLTYKGITKKWTEDGKGNFLDYVGKPKIVYDLAKEENESIIDFTKRMIDEGVFK